METTEHQSTFEFTKDPQISASPWVRVVTILKQIGHSKTVPHCYDSNEVSSSRK